MPLLDGRPPAVDTRFRPGNTFTVTFNWPAGSLTGRTFTAALDATSLTLNIAGDDMVVSMTEAQTLAAANVGEFVLTETTGGASDVVIVGSWHSSNGPSAGETTAVSVNDSSGVVTVIAQAIPGNAVTLTGAQTIGGTKTFSASPVVPNPAALGVNAAVSVDEVDDILAGYPAGFYRALGSKTALATIANTTTETSLLQAVYVMPKITEDAVWRLTAHGALANNSGGSVTFTFRLKNTTDTITLATLALALPTDTLAARPFKVDIVGEGNTFLSAGNMNVGELLVGAGNVDTLKQVMSQNAASASGSDPQNWDVTVQMSVAHANATLAMYGASIAYSLPGA